LERCSGEYHWHIVRHAFTFRTFQSDFRTFTLAGGRHHEAQKCAQKIEPHVPAQTVDVQVRSSTCKCPAIAAGSFASALLLLLLLLLPCAF
jgi:hypothetical protein